MSPSEATGCDSQAFVPRPLRRQRKLVALVAFLAIVVAVVVAPTRGSRAKTPRRAAPFGHIDRVDVDFASRSVVVQGWAIDAQTPDPIAVHIYVNGVLRAGAVADGSRVDVGAAYPSFGDRHGYAVSVPAESGANVVCIYGINVGVGVNSLIGCRVVTIEDAPFGSVDRVDVGAGLQSVVVHGWAIDAQTPDPIAVHVYVNGVLRGGGVADGSCVDVGAAYPSFGARHGYAVSVPARAGINVVCVYGINVGAGANRLIGCRERLGRGCQRARGCAARRADRRALRVRFRYTSRASSAPKPHRRGGRGAGVCAAMDRLRPPGRACLQLHRQRGHERRGPRR